MDLIEKAYSCTKLWISMIVVIIYSVLLVSYQHHIQGLEKPAGMQEALVFLFNYPQDYFGALILGLVIHAICVVMIICLILCFIGIVTSRVAPNVVMMINLVMTIIMIVLNNLYVKYVSALVMAIAVIGIVGWAIANADT